MTFGVLHIEQSTKRIIDVYRYSALTYTLYLRAWPDGQIVEMIISVNFDAIQGKYIVEHYGINNLVFGLIIYGGEQI